VKDGSFMYKIVHIFVFVFVSFKRILYICIRLHTHLGK